MTISTALMSVRPVMTAQSATAAPAVQAPGLDETAPTTAPAKESVLHKAEAGVADVIVELGKIPFLGKLGVMLYGLVSKPKASQAPLSNTAMLSPTLERGAQPTTQGFADLKAQGVQTVVNLRPEYNETAEVQSAGMKCISLPLPPIGAPTNAQALQFLSIVTDPANGKVFFHCQHGADRTGAMAAAYHIAVDGWTADQCIADLPNYGFHAGVEDDKVKFIQQFAGYWASLPAATKAQTLHQGLNATA